MRAELAASIERANEFELQVEAEGIEPTFIAAAKNGIVTVLVSQSWSPVFAVRIRLFAFRPHPEESSYAAFYNAGAHAAKRLLGTTENTAFNIAWPGEYEA